MTDCILLTGDELDFVHAYLEAVDFTETGDTEQPPIGSELTDDFERASIIDCLAFYQRIKVYLPYEEARQSDPLTTPAAQAGHDFWLTRNGHGAGFWDGDWQKYGEMFTKIAQSFGEVTAEYQP